MRLVRKNVGADNNNNNGGGGGGMKKSCFPAVACKKPFLSSSSCFRPGVKLIVRRAPLLSGLSAPATTTTSSSGLNKKYQRPFQKRRAVNRAAEQALKQSSLGQKRRMNGMAKLLARAGRGLLYKLPSSAAQQRGENSGTDDESDSDDDEQQEDRPFEPLLVWRSPHPQPKKPPNSSSNNNNNTSEGNKNDDNEGDNSGDDDHDDNIPVEPKGLPPRLVEETRFDEYGIEEKVMVIKPAPIEAYSKHHVYVPPVLAKWLRPHQREGVHFMYQCVMGLKDYKGNGCILADDMGLGKTLQSVTLIYTLLKTGITANGAPTAKRVIVICPCSLVKNWANEFVKWLGPNAVKVLAISEGDRKSVERDIDSFVRTNIFNILVASYECIRTHINRIIKKKDCCDLLVCDEAHRLKNSDNQTSRALNSIPVKRRVLLTGTPMQNDLTEFYAMVDFTNPGILGTPEEFRRKTLFPILRGREPDATDAQKRKMMELQNEMSTKVNEFILRRVNTLNAQHLPPKLVQVVCCNLTEIQQNMYQHLVNSKDMQHVLDGKQVNCLASIQMLMKLANHPSLVADCDEKYGGNTSSSSNSGGRRAASKKKAIKYSEDDNKETTAAPGADGISKFLPYVPMTGRNAPVHPEWSGKMYVLYRLMKEMRKPGNGNDKIVIVSNYTQTLDLIGRMCSENSWGFCRLDGSISMKKRQKMVDEFNDPSSPLIAFLLSSKAGGCGLNLIGGNRLVLFDPDWNPAVDKQAAARCWRDGQKKRCFTYRFLATGTVEEKIFQRQLSKEGLQSVVDDKEQVNALSTKDLRNLFKLRTGTPSDTHDKLRCERCAIIHDNAEMEAKRVLPKQLKACRLLLDEMFQQEDASFFRETLDPTAHGRTKEEYEKVVKQPMDLGTIKKKLDLALDQPSAYKKVSDFAKDVNRIFSNVMKLWEPGEEIADRSRRLQTWWLEKWSVLVPQLMGMKPDDHPEERSDDGKGTNEAAAEDVLESCANVHNERGEDYQEQIGMPDEENMRHWSHHHTTDTVDDPVFRAAMRGCDSVSFVFGLEVTWSLIQQRQEEEEERLAMEEMNAAAELLGEEHEDDDCKPAAVTEESSMNDDDDPQGQEGSTNEEADDENASDSEEDAIGVVGDEKASGGDRNPVVDLVDSDDEETQAKTADSPVSHVDAQMSSGEKITPSAQAEVLNESSPEGSAAVAEVASSQSSSDSSPGNKENLSQPGSNEWACPSCTLHNMKPRRKCTACGTQRPPASKKRSFDQVND